MNMRFFLWILLPLSLAAIALVALFLVDMQRAYSRIQDRASIIASPWARLQFLLRGSGSPVLVVHGSGGGYDQAELIAEALLDDDTQWILPSRFGYLGSSLPEAASWDAQADAYAFLLDTLEVERVAVVAMSHGGPSALVFAERYPERVTSLTLVSCGVTPVQDAAQASANERGNALRTIYRFDFLYWFLSRFFKARFLELIGADGDVIASLSPGQRDILGRFVDYMNPASPRSAGVVFDNETELPGARIANIVAPTLIVHARDDQLQLYENARFADATIPDSTLLSFDRGGHVVIAVEQAAIREAVRAHMRANDADRRN